MKYGVLLEAIPSPVATETTRFIVIVCVKKYHNPLFV